MTSVTVAPITSTVKGRSSEVPLDGRNGIDHECAVSLDNVVTIPSASLGRTTGFLAGTGKGLGFGDGPRL